MKKNATAQRKGDEHRINTKTRSWHLKFSSSQKSVKNLVGFLGDLKTPKFNSEINRDLKTCIFEIEMKNINLIWLTL